MPPENARPLLILDLDETLIYGTEEPLSRAAELRVGLYHVYRRPHASAFLLQVAKWFQTAVWSSASRSYVSAITTWLFAELPAPRFVWAAERCTQRVDFERHEAYWVKDLKKVKRAGYPLERVLVIDDSPEKLERNYGNLLRVRPFVGAEDDDELRALLPFLNELRHVEDFRRVEKRRWRGQ